MRAALPKKWIFMVEHDDSRAAFVLPCHISRVSIVMQKSNISYGRWLHIQVRTGINFGFYSPK
jgi:hypothetical protein